MKPLAAAFAVWSLGTAIYEITNSAWIWVVVDLAFFGFWTAWLADNWDGEDKR